MLERTDAITNEVLEPITFVVAYPPVLIAFPLQQWLHERASLLRRTKPTLPLLLLYNNSVTAQSILRVPFDRSN